LEIAAIEYDLFLVDRDISMINMISIVNEFVCPVSAVRFAEWWVQSIIIEYFNCRRFAKGNELWSFDFDLVSKEEIKRVPNLDIIVSANCMLYHNISQAELTDKFAKIMSGQPYTLISKNMETVVNGPAGNDYFPLFWNPIEVWDPKSSI
jgi:hypothetical protein